MRLRRTLTASCVLLCVLTSIPMTGCGDQSTPGPENPEAQATSKAADPAINHAELKDEIPSSVVEPVMSSLYKGLGMMEQYRYREAVAEFREIHRLAPGWIPGSINLAIALLNDTGTKTAESERGGTSSEPSNFEEAVALLEAVAARDPDNRHAHYSLGVILEQQGDLARAHEHFKRVTELDPRDASSWYWMASTVSNAGQGGVTGPSQAEEQIRLLTRALECDPYLTPAIYKLSFAYRLAGKPEKQKELLERWRQINPDRPMPVPGPGNSADKVYGEMGRYASIINPFSRKSSKGADPSPEPRFDTPVPLNVKLADGDRWVTPPDFQASDRLRAVGRARDRFGAAIASFDANRDGKLDLYMASAIVGPKGVRDALLLNQGEGVFLDASSSFGLPPDKASIGVAAADFDADRFVDLYLTGVGENRLLRNLSGKSFVDSSDAIKTSGPASLSLNARWLDLDQDGDLDLYVVNHCRAEDAARAFDHSDRPPGMANAVYRNDGVPQPISGSPAPAWAPLAVSNEGVAAKGGLSLVLTPWPEAEALIWGQQNHTGIAAGDIDGDRDIDLVLSADHAPPIAVLNDRLGKFHQVELNDLKSLPNANGLLVTDLDADGLPDLVCPTDAGKVAAWRNATARATTDQLRIHFETWPSNAESWRSAQAVDLDLDGRSDLLGLPLIKTSNPSPPAWARNLGDKLEARVLPAKFSDQSSLGIAYVDLIGDPLPDLVSIRPGQAPELSKNLGNGNHWLGLQLGGHWGVKPQLMRTNSHAIGARILVEGQGIHVNHDHTTQESGLSQSEVPIVLGLGTHEAAELVHVRWPDGVMQCELNVAGNQMTPMAENNRKTGSCPVLFTWNGERFVCLGDFLGGGGLGYLVAPGIYGQPDRDEALAITSDQLRATEGVYRMSVTEPMDEVAYLDHLRLEVIDRPPGVSSTPDERFAPSGRRPTGELLAWKSEIQPVRATDLGGKDVTETLKAWDRRTVDSFRKLDGWIGYAEEHGIVLDFGDCVMSLKPEDRVVLCLAGWVEYPYSQTNYAAASAGISLNPPRVEKQRTDGTWEVIAPDAGYPAGLPRMTTLELTGKLTGPRCVLRIRTNMECYYDQAFLMLPDRATRESLKVSTIDVTRAVLGPRGYTREASPDGRLPLLYEYDYVDPAPLARMAGKLTRFGEVSELLRKDDDLHCLVGPGDEVRMEFDARALTPLPKGWTRSYVLRTYGYCKDADPFTAGSDTVEPLPWKEMPAYPFASDIRKQPDDSYSDYLRRYHTRPAGGGPTPRL